MNLLPLNNSSAQQAPQQAIDIILTFVTQSN